MFDKCLRAFLVFLFRNILENYYMKAERNLIFQKHVRWDDADDDWDAHFEVRIYQEGFSNSERSELTIKITEYPVGG